MMTDQHYTNLLAARLKRAGTTSGRLRLQAYMTIKCLSRAFLTRSSAVAKRTFDIVVASILLVILLPLMLIVGILVARDGGPVLFQQPRVGRRGSQFPMLKFRSMCVNAEERLKELSHLNQKSDGITFKIANDPRITPVGRFIRKTSIDELPQLINVLRGDMSIVGPRPPLPREVDLYSLGDRRRLLVRPGITCLWQIGEREGRLFEIGNRNEIEFAEQVALDVKYVESSSLRKDILILLKTVPAVLLGKGGV